MALLLEDIFEVEELNPGGKRFDKVDRVRCRSQQQELELQLDVNCEIYPLPEGAAFSLALAPTLSPDGAPDGDTFDQSGAKSLADGYEYVMHGMVFKIEEVSGSAGKVSVTASFGGLLMLLSGDKRSLGELALDQKVYLLVRKV